MAQQVLEGTWEEIAAHAGELTALYSNTRLLTFDRDLPKQAIRNAPGVDIHLL